MRVLAVASECFPLVKTGGLADVAGALPGALRAIGMDVRTLIPGYPSVMAGLGDAESVVSHASFFGGAARLLAAGNLLVLDAPHLFARTGGPYADADGQDWPDNLVRFAAFSRMAADVGLGALPGWQPDIVHAHDWQAGLVPAFLHFSGAHPPSVLTVHNLAFQGRFPAGVFPILGLPAAAMGVEGMEFYGDVSVLKAGLVYADRVTTVSPGYAAEIQTAEHGMGLDGVLRGTGVSGILNGIDIGIWDPASDGSLTQRYGTGTIVRRSFNKAALQAEFGLPADPEALLFAVISRLSWQKGLDLLLEALPALLESGGQLALLGSGEAGLEAGFRAAAAGDPRIRCVIGYDEAVAHRLQGGADALLVPSRFEPCGLTQLCALRYGCVPVVARVGGLADTVPEDVGVSFSPVTVQELEMAIRQTAALFRSGDDWREMQARGMATDVSWGPSAAAYGALFRELVG